MTVLKNFVIMCYKKFFDPVHAWDPSVFIGRRRNFYIFLAVNNICEAVKMNEASDRILILNHSVQVNIYFSERVEKFI